MSGSINHGGYRAINLGAPSAASDGATKGYVDGILGGNNKYWTYSTSGKYLASVDIYYVAGWIFPANFQYNGSSGAFSTNVFFNPMLTLTSPKPIIGLTYSTAQDGNQTHSMFFTAVSNFPVSLYTQATHGNFSPYNTFYAFYYVGPITTGLNIVAGPIDGRVTAAISGPTNL